MKSYRSLFHLFVFILTFVAFFDLVDSSPNADNLPDKYHERFKNQFHQFGRKHSLKSELLHQRDETERVHGWVVQVILPDKDCSSPKDHETTISPTGCVKDSESTSMRVSCHSSMIWMEEFTSSTNCGGMADSTWTTPVGQCLVSSASSTSSSSVYSCIANPTGFTETAANAMNVKTKGNSTAETPGVSESSSETRPHSSQTLTAICVSLSGMLFIALVVWWNYETIVDFLAKRKNPESDRKYLAMHEIPEAL